MLEPNRAAHTDLVVFSYFCFQNLVKSRPPFLHVIIVFNCFLSKIQALLGTKQGGTRHFHLPPEGVYNCFAWGESKSQREPPAMLYTPAGPLGPLAAPDLGANPCFIDGGSGGALHIDGGSGGATFAV